MDNVVAIEPKGLLGSKKNTRNVSTGMRNAKQKNNKPDQHQATKENACSATGGKEKKKKAQKRCCRERQRRRGEGRVGGVEEVGVGARTRRRRCARRNDGNRLEKRLQVHGRCFYLKESSLTTPTSGRNSARARAERQAWKLGTAGRSPGSAPRETPSSPPSP
ncbi:hypothetical protein CC78DRAFT_74740 [Lojkania enalia]|uniref:Uncharacterized protein n=1 Tax=Lojkania enalia TaxID=147567 RepID=A0A9P4JY06_9PLEO|nr:hypothetical protein CC78DRAFT_74740 [Didymosphaeria enalia]